MEDFNEDEVVWSYDKDKEDDSSPTQRKYNHKEYYSSSFSSAWRIPRTQRKFKRVSNSVTSLENKVVTQKKSSAPMNIPDWSKIYGKHHAENGSWVDNNGMDDMVHNGDVDYDHGHDDADDDDDEMVPPHEWLAKKLARSQISSFSVCEGVGRTLKGRDLSKVRNAVLTKTGFLE